MFDAFSAAHQELWRFLMVPDTKITHCVRCGTQIPEPRTKFCSKECFRAIGGTSSMYGTWKNMIARCFNPKAKGFEYYGGRGIMVCARWRDSFMAFVEDMGERPDPTYQIDRIDNNGNYEPNNCRWIDRKTNCLNRSRRRMLEHDGRIMHASEWSEETGIPLSQILKRIYNGEPSELVLSRESLRFVRSHRLTLNGKTQTISQWAADLGIPKHRIKNRLRRGYPVDEALSLANFR